MIWLSSAAPGEEITDSIHLNAQSGFPAPLAEQVAPFAVRRAEGETTNASLRGNANLSHLHKTCPKTLAINVLHELVLLLQLVDYSSDHSIARSAEASPDWQLRPRFHIPLKHE
jgi:hypothetical protein